jgi:two-component system, sensor histidine kinase PdtaS
MKSHPLLKSIPTKWVVLLTCILMLSVPIGVIAQSATIEVQLSQLANVHVPKDRIPILTNLAVAYLYRNPDSSIYYASDLLSTSRQTANISGEADAYRIKGMALVAMSKNRDALVPLMAAKQILDTLGNPRKAASNDAMIAQALSALNEYEESNKILEKSLETCRREKSMEGVALMLAALSSNARYQRKMLTAIELGEEAYHILDSMGIRQNLSRIGNNLSFCFEYVGNYDKAISVLLRDLPALEKGNLYGDMLQTKTRLVFLYTYDKQFEKGEREGREAIKIANDLGREDYTADVQVHLATLYRERVIEDSSYLDSAIALLESSEAIYSRLSKSGNSNTNKGNIYVAKHELGIVYRVKGDYTKAHALAEESMASFIENADTPYICNSLHLQGNIFIAESKFDSALSVFKRMEELVLESSQPLNMSFCDALEGQAEAYKGLGEIDEAYLIAKRLLNVRDSLEDSGSEFEKVGLQERYENELRDRERLGKITELKIESDDRKRKYQVALVTGVLVATICMLLFLLYRRIRKQNQKLAELQATLEARNHSLEQANAKLVQSEQLVKNLNFELYHYVKNVIWKASAYARSSISFIETDNDKMIVSDLADKYRALADIHHLLLDLRTAENPDLGEFVKTFTNKVVKQLWFGDSGLAIVFDVEPMVLKDTHAQAIGLLLEEFLTNSIKHAFPDKRSAEIKVSLHLKQESVRFTYEDNGIGISKDAIEGDGRGYGMHFVSTTVEKDLKGKVEWTQGITRIVINFPYEKA